MDSSRPDPGIVLKRIQHDDARQARGKLKIFFGSTAGVGKTYALLEAAHEQQRDGIDVVIGGHDHASTAYYERNTLIHGRWRNGEPAPASPPYPLPIFFLRAGGTP